MSEYLRQSEAAEVLRVSTKTLERWRVAGTGPAFIRLGARILYRRADLDAFAGAHVHVSTSAAGAAA